MTVPERANPIVRLLISILKERGISYDTLAEASGVLRASIKQWRTKTSPSYATISACFEAIGWSFIPVPRIEVLPEEIAADLARVAAKMQSEMPIVWAALADLAADQQFMHERAKGRIEAIEAEREANRLERKRRRIAKRHANDNTKQSTESAA